MSNTEKLIKKSEGLKNFLERAVGKGEKPHLKSLYKAVGILKNFSTRNAT